MLFGHCGHLGNLGIFGKGFLGAFEVVFLGVWGFGGLGVGRVWICVFSFCDFWVWEFFLNSDFGRIWVWLILSSFCSHVLMVDLGLVFWGFGFFQVKRCSRVF